MPPPRPPDDATALALRRFRTAWVVSWAIKIAALGILAYVLLDVLGWH